MWDDSISVDEFEKQWPIILSDFNLSDHSWLGDIYNIRQDWIPAYYRDEKFSGLMRTTSRCESENHFFKKFCNRKSTLVEFLSHFDSAIEVQRYDHRKNDHDTRYTDAQLWSTFVLERQAAQYYTRTIFLDQQLEIDYGIHNCLAMNTITVDDFVSVEIKDFLQPCSSYFKVRISGYFLHCVFLYCVIFYCVFFIYSMCFFVFIYFRLCFENKIPQFRVVVIGLTSLGYYVGIVFMFLEFLT